MEGANVGLCQADFQLTKIELASNVGSLTNNQCLRNDTGLTSNQHWVMTSTFQLK